MQTAVIVYFKILDSQNNGHFGKIIMNIKCAAKICWAATVLKELREKIESCS